MTTPRQPVIAPELRHEPLRRTARHLNWFALALAIVSLGCIAMAGFGDRRMPWPMAALPILLIAQTGYAFGWFRRWPTVQRLFPIVNMLLVFGTLVGIMRVYFGR